MAPELDLLMFPQPGRAAEVGAMVEAAGWDGIYLADTQNLAADVHVTLGIMATATERLRLVTGVTNPITRHPAVTATAIATVHAASGGRAVLGIGRGDSSLGYLGRKPASVDVFETYVARVRGFLNGEDVELDDGVSRNRWIAERGVAPVPIDVAATGPRVIGVAARLADRVTFGVGADPARLRDAVALLRSERKAAGLDPDGVSVGAYVNTVAHPDVDVAREIVRGGAASFAHFSGMAGAPKHDGPDGAIFEAIGTGYDMEGHGAAGSAHAASLPDEFLDRFAVAGPVDRCVARLGDLVEAGAERLVVVPGSRDADPTAIFANLTTLATEVLPRLR
ncbi:MAG: LLM class flavin-dependent oxidoreductase [Actinomycetota bacterium]